MVEKKERAGSLNEVMTYYFVIIAIFIILLDLGKNIATEINKVNLNTRIAQKK